MAIFVLSETMNNILSEHDVHYDFGKLILEHYQGSKYNRKGQTLNSIFILVIDLSLMMELSIFSIKHLFLYLLLKILLLTLN